MSNKTELLIVDGYNIINAWPELNRLKNVSFEDARQKLMGILINYQGFKNNRIIIVFDAHQVRGGIEKRENHLSLEVVFTREGETADMYIERIAGELPFDGHIFVATSDWIEQSISFQRGAFRISARELYQDITSTLRENMKTASDEKRGFGQLHYNLPIDIKEKLEEWRRGK
jgi:predicted RNA-binding protein with PIN domain